jgi:hypothetical protein
MQEYTAPTTAISCDGSYRVYFTTRPRRDAAGNHLTRICFVDLDRDDPRNVLYEHARPLLSLGEPGAFDEFGTMVAEAVAIDDTRILLYYMGWQRGTSVPYFINVGAAVSGDGGATFERVSKGPLFGVDRTDPFGIGNLSILKDGEMYRMWYTSFTSWHLDGENYCPQYLIKYAESEDCLTWTRPDITCIQPAYRGEAIATPCVCRIGDFYHMWFSHRAAQDYHGGAGSYRIGYAWSEDGMTWTRKDDVGGLSVSDSPWESEMVAYPCVLREGDKLRMFYNGNDFGREGFGLAECSIRDLQQRLDRMP